jgi:hypothetical protein
MKKPVQLKSSPQTNIEIGPATGARTPAVGEFFFAVYDELKL